MSRIVIKINHFLCAVIDNFNSPPLLLFFLIAPENQHLSMDQTEQDNQDNVKKRMRNKFLPMIDKGLFWFLMLMM